MAIQTTAMKDILANAYHGAALYGALYTTIPGDSAGTEVSGGSPLYARKAMGWTSGNGTSATVTFDVPASTTVSGFGLHSALTGGTYYDGVGVTPQTFASQGTYAVTATYTQS